MGSRSRWAHGPVAGRVLPVYRRSKPLRPGAEDPPGAAMEALRPRIEDPPGAAIEAPAPRAPKTSEHVTGSTVATEQRKRLAAICPLLVDGDEPDRHGRIVCGQTHAGSSVRN